MGGPIKKNKVFFFGSLEGFRRDQSLFTLFTVPDARLRAGDFSQALNSNGSLQQIYDPDHRDGQRLQSHAVRQQSDSVRT